jgi:RNA polymerase sigma-70 factor (ECF subfamily)
MVAVMQSGGEPTQAEFHDVITNRADRWFAACLKITRNRAMAEDAVQEALLSAWVKRSQFHRDSRLDTWIHRIAVNAALQLLRKNRPASFEPLDFEIPDDADSQEDRQYAGDLERDLAKALTGLSDIERVCFVLKHLEQWRLKEIAEELDTNIGVIKQALFRGVRKLRKRMTTLQGV